MQSRSLGMQVAAALILFGELLIPHRFSGAGAQTFLVASPGSFPGSPAIAGHLVVWTSSPPGWQARRLPGSAIYGKDLSTGRRFRVTGQGTAVGRPAISGAVVVWVDCRHCTAGHGLGYRETEIYGKDLATGRTFPVAAQPGDQAAPAISPSIVVWQERRDGHTAIQGKNLATGWRFRVGRQSGDQAAPSISGHIVVWQERLGDTADIFGEDLSTGRLFPVALHAGASDVLRDPIISGHWVVWVDWNGGDEPATVVSMDLTIGRSLPITTIPYGHFNPQLGPDIALSGHIVVWDAAERAAFGNTNYDIHGMDLATGRRFQVTSDPHDQILPAISGTTVVWDDARGGRWAIYGTHLPPTG